MRKTIIVFIFFVIACNNKNQIDINKFEEIGSICFIESNNNSIVIKPKFDISKDQKIYINIKGKLVCVSVIEKSINLLCKLNPVEMHNVNIDDKAYVHKKLVYIESSDLKNMNVFDQSDDPYYLQINKMILNNWNPPIYQDLKYATNNQSQIKLVEIKNQQIQILIKINREGELLDYLVYNSQKISSLDESCIDAILITKYPKLTPRYDKDAEWFKIGFDYVSQ